MWIFIKETKCLYSFMITINILKCCTLKHKWNKIAKSIMYCLTSSYYACIYALSSVRIKYKFNILIFLWKYFSIFHLKVNLSWYIREIHLAWKQFYHIFKYICFLSENIKMLKRYFFSFSSILSWMCCSPNISR